MQQMIKDLNRVVWFALLAAILVVVSGGSGCAHPNSTPSDARPNVLVVVIDGCRPDKFGCYGFDRPTTPAIDSLADDPDGVVFERHYVQGDWTKPSTASLFTGLYLYQHRVAIGPEPQSTPYWSQVLSEKFFTLAEAFQGAGYNTFGAVGIPHLLPKYGFDQGFERYKYLSGDREATETSLEWAASDERPFFGYLHLVGCHDPYPDSDRDPAYFSSHRFPYNEGDRQAIGIDFTDPQAWMNIYEALPQLEPDDIRFLHLLHESKLRALDERIITPFLQELRARGMFDDTLIVLTADHGQELLEHGGYTSAHALWEEVIRVPLVIKFPRGKKPQYLESRYSGLSRAIDLFPSLLGAAGADIPDEMPGTDLFSAPEITLSLSERYSAGAEVDWAAIRGDVKVLRVLESPTAVFDLKSDPGETNDLADSLPEVIAEAQRAVAELRARYPAPPIEPDPGAPELTDDELEALRSLGYIQ
jgi:arylsulfatase A-like enzyme